MRMSDLDDPARPFRRAEHPRKRKKATNVSIDSELLVEAKALKINLSQTLEDELRRRVKEEKIRAWTEENREALDSYNRFIAEHGVLSENYRKW